MTTSIQCQIQFTDLRHQGFRLTTLAQFQTDLFAKETRCTTPREWQYAKTSTICLIISAAFCSSIGPVIKRVSIKSVPVAKIGSQESKHVKTAEKIKQKHQKHSLFFFGNGPPWAYSRIKCTQNSSSTTATSPQKNATRCDNKSANDICIYMYICNYI